MTIRDLAKIIIDTIAEVVDMPDYGIYDVVIYACKPLLHNEIREMVANNRGMFFTQLYDEFETSKTRFSVQLIHAMSDVMPTVESTIVMMTGGIQDDKGRPKVDPDSPYGGD